LEKEPLHESQRLFNHELQNEFFEQLMQGSLQCLKALKVLEQAVGAKPLPKKLLLQMDNCVKDNKNRRLLFFLSLLIAKEVFEKVQLRFLVIGHTHEDIDGSFGYLSKNLKKQNNYVLENLMKAFMASQERPFIPQPIQEIANFKSWVQGYLKDEFIVLVGHTNMHLF
jgi:hypothetical protein